MRPLQDCGDERRCGFKGYQGDKMEGVGPKLQRDNGVKELSDYLQFLA